MFSPSLLPFVTLGCSLADVHVGVRACRQTSALLMHIGVPLVFFWLIVCHQKPCAVTGREEEGCLKNHRRALILLIRSERDVAFPRNYLHTVNLSLGGPSKPNPRRHAAISRMRREGRRLRCWLTLLSTRMKLGGGGSGAEVTASVSFLSEIAQR